MKNKKCPKCAEIGRDRTGDHLWQMQDGTTWACLKPYHPPYYEQEDGVATSYVSFGVKDVKELPFHGSPERMVSSDTHEKFRVRTELSQENRSPVCLYYPETYKKQLIGYKVRRLPKKFAVIKGSGYVEGRTPDLFGQFRAPTTGKRLLICAGEEDTLAADEMLTEKYPDASFAVVGLPRGESGIEPVAENLPFIKCFDEVIVATDMDEAGRQALTKIVSVIGEGTKTLNISEKDVSDMLTRGKQKEFINAFFNAKEWRPANIVTVSEILEDSVQPVQWGLSYPWPKLTALTYGMKARGEIIGLGAAPGAGKTTLWQGIQKHLIFEHEQEIAIFDIEEGAVQGLKKLIGSVMNRPIHKPDCIYDIDQARTIGESFQDKALFYGGDSENWAEVESAIRYFASRGIRFFFIDPLSALVEHLPASEANTELGIIMRAMRKFRKNQGLTFFHANHLNNPSSGKEHGEGGKVLGSQFTGSRAQWKYSTLLLGFERNQYEDDPEDRNTGALQILKDRLGGNTGKIPMKYNMETGNLDEYIVEDVL